MPASPILPLILSASRRSLTGWHQGYVIVMMKRILSLVVLFVLVAMVAPAAAELIGIDVSSAAISLSELSDSVDVLAATLPDVRTSTVTSITSSSATIWGWVANDGGSSITERRFDWDTSTPLEKVIWSDSVTVSGNYFSSTISGLSPNTRYYYRAWAKNSAGWGHGDILSFTTESAASTLSFTSLTPSDITTSQSTYDVTLVAIGSNFKNVNQVTFSWSGSDSGSQTWNKGDTNWNSLVTVNSDTAMTLQARVLSNVDSTQTKRWTWTVTLRDTSGATKSRTFTVTFTPEPIVSPSVSTSSATNVGSNQATLNGYLSSMGGASSCTVYFQYGTTTSYGSTTGTQAKSSAGTFSQSLTGLSPGTTYHYRAVASNSAGTVYGADTTFTTSNNRAFGIDVSHHQNNINWRSVHNSGKSFAFVKATEGKGYTDPKFQTNMDSAFANEMLVGAYHFARPDLGNSATDEASYFVDIAGKYISEGYLRPVLDLECGASLGKEALSEWVKTWISTVHAKTDVYPIIYVNPNYATNYLKQDINQNDLWIAHWKYDPSLSPNTGIWTNWAFWQYSDKGQVSGIEGDVDLDVFNGDLSSLQNYVITPTPHSDQPTFKAPWEGAARITQGTNGATSHYDHGTWDNTYALDIASMTPGETFDILAPYDGTVCHIDNDEDGAGGKEVAICHTYGGNEYITVYLHLSEILVANGASIRQGEKFAVSGMTGSATGVHLHFHMYKAPGAYDSHTQPIKRIILKKTGIDSDFKEYNQAKGELDDSVISKYNNRVFESNNIRISSITSPSVSTSSATNVGSNQATLNGYLSSMGGASSCTVYFQYGTTTSYGSTTGTQAKSSAGTFSQSLTGLSPGTTYHYRAVASNSAGTVYGADTTFTTSSSTVPADAILYVTNVSGVAPESSATVSIYLNNSFDPKAGAAQFKLYYNESVILAESVSVSTGGVMPQNLKSPITFAFATTSGIPTGDAWLADIIFKVLSTDGSSSELGLTLEELNDVAIPPKNLLSSCTVANGTFGTGGGVRVNILDRSGNPISADQILFGTNQVLNAEAAWFNSISEGTYPLNVSKEGYISVTADIEYTSGTSREFAVVLLEHILQPTIVLSETGTALLKIEHTHPEQFNALRNEVEIYNLTLQGGGAIVIALEYPMRYRLNEPAVTSEVPWTTEVRNGTFIFNDAAYSQTNATLFVTSYLPKGGQTASIQLEGGKLGDVYYDHKITATDALYILHYNVGNLQSLDTYDYVDVYRDGKITATDALYIQHYLVGNLNEFYELP